ncbi:hypothetical protein Tco_0022522 [Tanacetum coccineum]
MANLQQASTSGTQTDKAPIYDSDGSAENDSDVITAAPSVEQSGGIVEQHFATVEEIHAYYQSQHESGFDSEMEHHNVINIMRLLQDDDMEEIQVANMVGLQTVRELEDEFVKKFCMTILKLQEEEEATAADKEFEQERVEACNVE